MDLTPISRHRDLQVLRKSRRRRLYPSSMVLILILLSVGGCNDQGGGSVANRALNDADAVYDPDGDFDDSRLYGVRTEDAPNQVLSEWLRQQPQQGHSQRCAYQEFLCLLPTRYGVRDDAP